MLKHKIKFLDNNGDQTEAAFYFNLTRIEILELDAEYDDDLRGKLRRIGAGEESNKQILAFFKDLIGRSYGERTPDGRFVKNTELTQAFVVTDAYSELLLSFFREGEASTKFIEGLMPADLVAQVRAEREKKAGPSDLQQQFVERAQQRVENSSMHTPPQPGEVLQVDTAPQQFRPAVDHMERPAMPSRRDLREGEVSADPNIGG